MFKEGDKIKAIEGSIAYTKYGNQILIVNDTKNIHYYKHNGDRVFYIEPGGNNNGWRSDWFRLAKNNPITEKDYLDCFKENFKEGV